MLLDVIRCGHSHHISQKIHLVVQTVGDAANKSCFKQHRRSYLEPWRLLQASTKHCAFFESDRAEDPSA